MKQVWMADDGKVFDEVEDCEAYEDKIKAKENLIEYLIAESDDTCAFIFLNNLDFYVKQGLAFKLRTYINAIEP